MSIRVPDYDDMVNLARKIRQLTSRRMSIDVEIKSREAEITMIMTTDSNYFQNGKAPSMSLIESTWRYTGITGELLPKRKELAEVIAELEEAKILFDIYKMQIDLFRTEAANNRRAEL
jgi:hypothetical protein